MTNDANIDIGIRGDVSGGRTVKATLDGISTSADKASTNTDKLEGKTNRLSTSMRQLAGVARGVVALFAGGFLSQAIDQNVTLQARVRNSTTSLEEYTEAWKRLKGIAANTGTTVQTSVEVFQRLTFVKEEINASNDAMLQFTDNVQKLGTISGASTANLNAGLTQLGQAMSSPIMRAEEFNSIMENIPVVGKAIADEFGITTGQMTRLVKEGEILSKDVFAALLNQTDDINQQFDKFPMTIGRAFNQFKIDMMSVVEEWDELTGTSELFIRGIGAASNVVQAFMGIIKGYVNTVKALFNSIKAGILDAFAAGIEPIQKMINLAIDGINLINPGEDIANVSLSTSGQSASEAAKAARLDASKQFGEAKDGFRTSFDKALETFTGGASNENTKSINNETREISKNYADIVQSLSDSEDKTNKVKDATKEVKTEMDRLSESIGSAFGKFLTGASSSRDALKGLANDLLGIAQQELVTKPFESAISGLFGSVLGSGASTGSTSSSGFLPGEWDNVFNSTVSSIGSSVFGGIGSLFGFDNGGEMRIGGNGGVDNNILSLNNNPIAKVSKGETIAVNPKASTSAGVIINQTINVSTGVQETVAAEFQTFLPKLKDATKAAVYEERLRGIN